MTHYNKGLHCTLNEPEGTPNRRSINSSVHRKPLQPACFDAAVTFADKFHKNSGTS